ncbi:MlaD family protein [Mucilaginibacter lappiensis]|uniref:Phospholipid/cholesterol/gamma-HCH transport system substrate-binding protein n=1 Tax=Mucilaginibacter lappiensis TaxID=354630 RepID=A0A1N6RT87_9SPHI|nr:MlaD family protein [Mucilaginibacter lappiensis]MBB6108585.1 phospholipid/cholesterol/gamma-HCH transport system substrate-binding protein [Mucilaginibacter lappiensis]MBB6129422.1 phospholipid/cholesterol/gamma-HCH transport system substrate-binding protein [Mucilaginibacter lappiensis]SIQ32035.1 phospholipid/cholesterol/gamma-HCH transport system substrate-binding protein [Mucilaginibacter lappiensis]
MKTTSSQKIKIGLFAFAGLVVLVLGIFFIGSRKGLFNSTFNLYGTFKNVSGLQVGNNVRFAGINIGVVQAINIVTDSSVRVDLTLNNSVKKFIKTDAKMSIGSDGLMGDKLVVIAPGGITSHEEVQQGGRLGSINPVDVDKIIIKLTRVADNAEALTTDLSQIVGKINNGKGSIGRLLNNDAMAKNIENTVKQAQTTMKNVHTTTNTLNEDLTAAQHNFLLRGFFNKKKKAAKAKQDSIKKVQEEAQKDKEKAAKEKVDKGN